MFAYIKGTLQARGSDYIVIEAGGIGYRIYTSAATLASAGQLGQEFKAYTRFYVREDVISLYGFATQEELGVFDMLLTVSGVGPKVALALLSAMSPSKFSLAVITGDTKALTKAQGVGAKLAQRIILELKDKIKKEQLDVTDDIGFDGQEVSQKGTKASEAVSALIVLGYTPAEASRAVASVYSDELDLETIIKNALKSRLK